MNIDEAYTEAVAGARVRCEVMQEGSWLEYNFAGFKRAWPSGTSCNFVATPAEEAAEWSIIELCSKCFAHIEPVEDSMEGRCKCPPPSVWGTPLTSEQRIQRLDNLIAAHPSSSPQRTAKSKDDAIVAAMAAKKPQFGDDNWRPQGAKPKGELGGIIGLAGWGKRLKDEAPADPPAAPKRDAWGRPSG